MVSGAANGGGGGGSGDGGGGGVFLPCMAVTPITEDHSK